jgi:prolyl oligopeptidase
MTDDTFAFSELETDAAAIAAFTATQNARTDARLTGPAYDADVATLRQMFERTDRVRNVIRRGTYLFTFRQTAENPRGLWLRLPETITPTHDAPWETVFDLDAHCRDTGKVWHWRGAATAWFDPTRVMIALSLDGSDMTRHVEFDTTTRSIVNGGFDLPPERGGSAEFLNAGTLLWTTSAGDSNATRSGWPRVVKHLHRDGTSQEVFRVGEEDLLAFVYLVPHGKGVQEVHVRMPVININESWVGGTRIPSPADTAAVTNGAHYAYVTRSDGTYPTGTLVLGRLGGTERALFSPGRRQAVEEDSVFFLGDWLIWKQTDTLRPTLMALDLRSDAAPKALPMPMDADQAWLFPHDANHLSGDGTLQLGISGFLQPGQNFLCDLHGGTDGITFRPLISQPEEFDATGLTVELLMATSDDGTEVPYHLVRKAGTTGPVMLYGYGGFGVSLGPGYQAVTGKLWLERGGAYAIAYIRGGGEFGPDWWHQAKGAGRHKSFEDFAAVARDIATRGIATPAQIACHGGSNGGLLCGVMLTRYSDRFGAVWASVGVQDMTRFHLFPAGAGWIDEDGDPDDPVARQWLLAYSPLHNVTTNPYPPALIDTSAHDDRVDPSHSRRFAAALQAAGHDALYYAHAGGHGGGGGSDERARELALGYAFLHKALGMNA